MVDYIRSAYRVPTRFFRDDPLSVLDIQWSFVPEITPGMPFAHAFGSRTWDIGEEEEPLIGELDGPRRWEGGLPPFPLPIIGPSWKDNLGLCGSEEQWKQGALTTDPVRPLWPFTGVKQCCKKPPIWANGGVAVGRLLGVVCGSCNDCPKLLFAQFVNHPGFPTGANGTWSMLFVPEHGFYQGFHTLPNGNSFEMLWNCSIAFPTLFLTSNGAQGGGVASSVRCYPYASDLTCDMLSPGFGFPLPGWVGDVFIRE